MALASPLTSSTRQGMAVRAAGAPASRLAPRATRLEVAAPGLQKPQKVQEASNIVELPAEAAAARRAALEAEVRAQLEAEHSWWRDDAASPPNMRTVSSKAEFKALIMEAPAHQLVVCDYLKPSCGACRRMYPKLQQIAAQNPDVLLVKVNVELNDELAELGEGMGVTHLPHFHLFHGGQLAASFSANVTTIATLRTAIETHMPASATAAATH